MAAPPPSYEGNMGQLSGYGSTATGHPTPSQVMFSSPPSHMTNTGNPLPYPQTGWNPAVYPTPPPYTEVVNQPQPVVVLPEAFFKAELRDTPGQTICPSCNLPCITTIKYTSGCLTTLLCCLIFFFGGILGCCLIPLCVDSCKDVDHHCPSCRRLIHKYKRL